jgi:hypothetical protein
LSAVPTSGARRNRRAWLGSESYRTPRMDGCIKADTAKRLWISIHQHQWHIDAIKACNSLSHETTYIISQIFCSPRMPYDDHESAYIGPYRSQAN